MESLSSFLSTFWSRAQTSSVHSKSGSIILAVPELLVGAVHGEAIRVNRATLVYIVI